MDAVSDSTPLIYLAKIGKISLLKKLFEEILIPRAIYEEVVIQGKAQLKNEVPLIEKLIEEKFIIIKEANSDIEIETLGRGEKECIKLCKELKINTLLIDEKEAFNISGIFNLTPIRTTSLLLILLDKKIINYKEYKGLLKKLLLGGYFLDVLTYEKLTDAGKNISNK